MANKTSTKEIHAALVRYLRGRPDLGIRTAIATRVLEPRNPFEPQSLPRLKRWSVLLLLVASGSTLAFAYFNFWH